MSSVPPQSDHHIGKGALERLAADVVDSGMRRVLIVSGHRSFTESGAAEQLEKLSERVDTRRWSDISPNTDITELRQGLQIVEEYQPDFVLGVGGGSVMDMAKLLCAFPSDGDHDALTGAVASGTPLERRTVGLGLAPTTSGSGSEATHFAVVYIGDSKYSIAGPALRPSLIALDPTLPASGSAHQRATSGMDAVCQAIESRWAVGSTRRSRRYSELALTTLLPSIRPFVSGDDSFSWPMQFGSHLAGRAIDISKTTAAHALSYSITKTYGVDHGSAAALTLGHFVEDHATRPLSDLQSAADPDLHAAAMARILRALDAPDGASALQAFVRLLDDLGLPATLSSVGEPSEGDLDRLAGSVNAQRLGNNPMSYDHGQLVGVLRRAAAPAVS